MFKKILNNLIVMCVVISLALIWYTAYKYNAKIQDPLVKQISKNITVELPDYYTYSVDKAYLTSYIAKTWMFALDKNITLDWIYNKNWLPLAFNHCSLLKKDAFSVDNDFDNDNIPDTKDVSPYDYTNWDYSIRKSTELDFDNDWLANAHDKDADGNWVDDIFQSICMDRVGNEDLLKKLYPKKAEDIFLTNKDNIKTIIEDRIFEFIDIYKIEDTFESDEQIDLFIEWLFNRLLFDDSIVLEFWDKSLIIEKKDILDSFRGNDELDYNE